MELPPSRVFTSVLLAILFCVSGCQSAPAAAPGLEAQFRSQLDALREEYRFPGATAAYILPDGSIGVAATGVSDAEAGTPMQRNSRMLAASIGKSFVGATAVALAEEGRLSLDAPISTWLEERRWFSRLPNHESITLRHLLTHSSGLPDHVYSPEFARGLAQNWRRAGNPYPPEALVEFVLDEPALFEAGRGWAYSDTGYILVGLILEAVLEHSYYDEIMQRFLVPLRLGLTTPSDRPILPLLAAGYLTEDSPLGLPVKTTIAPGIMAWNPALEWTGGGLVSNSRDLVVWAKALYESRALSGPALEELLRSVPVDGDNPNVQYGAGVGIYEGTALGPVYGHGGQIPGYTSSMRYYPAHGVAVAFQINSDIVDEDDSAPLIGEMERRLTEVVMSALRDDE